MTWRERIVLSLIVTAVASTYGQHSAAESFATKPAKKLAPVELKERPAELEGYGEQYDLAKYEECRHQDKRNTACEVYRLRRQLAPETWPFHKQPPNIKWPEQPKESVYEPGMGPIEYWRALCKAEAGEFIYRSVKNVKSIYQIRPRPKEIRYAFADRYVMEDPYGYIEAESAVLGGIPWMVTGPGWMSRKSSGKYPSFETRVLVNDIHWTQQKYYSPQIFEPNTNNLPYQRFYDYDRRDRKTMRMEYTDKIASRYGWTWRGIKRPLDREVGVAGGELAVVDLKTGEILGLRRGFILGARQLGGRVGWGGGNVCPEYHRMPGIGEIRGRSKDFDFSFWFINKVLIPVGEYQD